MKPRILLESLPDRILARARSLLERGAIVHLERGESELLASVQGTTSEPYEVRIRFSREDITEWSCTCPYEGEVCKHVAAVVLKVFGPGKIRPGRRRKTKVELAREILTKLNAEELREFVGELAEREKAVRDALLARFSAYADPGTRSLEAKYNLIFRAILQGYKRQGFVHYWEALEFGQRVSELVESGRKLVAEGKTEEALALAKAVLQGWLKALDAMDDSGGSTGVVLAEVLDLMVQIYRAGRTEVFEFLLEEARKDRYRQWGIDLNLAEALVEMAETRSQAKKLRDFLDPHPYGQEILARLLARFFPEEYEEFVWKEENLLQVWKFHLERLEGEKRLEAILPYLEHLLSSKAFPSRLKAEVLWRKARVLRLLGRNEEALSVLETLFKREPSLEVVREIQDLASPERWRKIRPGLEGRLRKDELFRFLVEEEEWERALALLEKEGCQILSTSSTLERLRDLLLRFPEGLRERALRKVLEISVDFFEEPGSRDRYRYHLSVIRPVLERLEPEEIRDFLDGLVKRYPRRRALREEAEALGRKLIP